jgi:hypothetical protein
MRSWGEGKVDDDAYEHERRGRGGGSMVAHAQKLASWSMPNWESFGVKVSRKGCSKWWCT